MRKLAIASLLVAGVALSSSVLAQEAAPQAAPAAPAAQAAPAAMQAAPAAEHKAASHHKSSKHHKSHKKAAKKSDMPATAASGG
ncbi:hypothetical protein ISP14_09510 [Dyella agri]|uniref:Uncharacterized protein n=2 Tax=Dyella agri TaxID=1926869 RepID=A0ABW8KFY6_9GAMM